MVRNLFIGTACALLSAGILATGAQAGEMDKTGQYYLGAAAGFVTAHDSDIDSNDFADENASFDNGGAVLLNLGTYFTNNLRGELELGYRKQDIGDVSGTTANGSIRAFSGMVNALYDFDINSDFTPYLGGGFGVTHIKASGSPINSQSVSDGGYGPALQAIAGVAYKLSDSASLTGQYNFLAVPDVGRFDLPNGNSFTSEYYSHTFTIGLRFALGGPKQMAAAPEPQPAAAPAPEPAPAPAPAPVPEVVRNYIVFFDWDSTALLPESLDILRTAAANAKKGKIVRLDATGHADRSGTATYNMGLSKRRAEAVKAELVRLGIPADEIAVQWKGETDPLVPTADGVREPQNRRVEIVFQ